MGYNSSGVSSFLMTLAILRPTNQAFCIISLNLDSSDVLFIVASLELCVWGRKRTQEPTLVSSCQDHTLSTKFTTANVGWLSNEGVCQVFLLEAKSHLFHFIYVHLRRSLCAAHTVGTGKQFFSSSGRESLHKLFRFCLRLHLLSLFIYSIIHLYKYVNQLIH